MADGFAHVGASHLLPLPESLLVHGLALMISYFLFLKLVDVFLELVESRPHPNGLIEVLPNGRLGLAHLIPISVELVLKDAAGVLVRHFHDFGLFLLFVL